MYEDQAIESVKLKGGRNRQLDLREWPRFRDESEAIQITANDREVLATREVREDGRGRRKDRGGHACRLGR